MYGGPILIPKAKNRYSSTPSLAISLLVPVLEPQSPMTNVSSMRKAASNKEDFITLFDKGCGARSWYLSIGLRVEIFSSLQIRGLHEQPCESDGDRFRECAQILNQHKQSIGLVHTWCTSYSTLQYHFLKPGGQDIKPRSFPAMLQITRLCSGCPSCNQHETFLRGQSKRQHAW